MTGQPGVIYMLHFDQPYRHASHYVGWTADLFDRLDQHAAGHGARLVAVIWHAGIGFTLIRICEGTRHTERAIKNAGGAVRYCPACTPRPRTATGSRCPPTSPPAPTTTSPEGGNPSCPRTPTALAATSATTPTSSKSCSSSSTAPPQASPGGGAPNYSPCPSWPPRGGGWTPGPPSSGPPSSWPGSWPRPSAVPHSRRFITRRFWCVLARHRLQRLCYEARLHTRSGRLPLILWTRPTKVGERTWVLCRAGICAEDFEAHIGELRAACYARDARVTRNRRWSHLLTIDIIRRDTLAACEIISLPAGAADRALPHRPARTGPPDGLTPDEGEPAA